MKVNFIYNKLKWIVIGFVSLLLLILSVSFIKTTEIDELVRKSEYYEAVTIHTHLQHLVINTKRGDTTENIIDYVFNIQEVNKDKVTVDYSVTNNMNCGFIINELNNLNVKVFFNDKEVTNVNTWNIETCVDKTFSLTYLVK
jgi:hypothetical protein